MKKRLVVTMLCALTLGSISASLVSCGEQAETPVVLTGVAISNKEALQEKWKVGEDNRKISFAATPDGANVVDAINAGTVTIVSSDTAVLEVLSQYLLPVAPGTATVTISLKTTAADGSVETKVCDTVEITILPAEAIDLNVLSVSAVMEKTNTKKYSYIVKGKVSKWKDKNTDGTKYGNFYLQDLKDTSKEILVYGATASSSAYGYDEENEIYTFNNPKDYLTNPVTSSIAIGDTIYMQVFRCDYNGTLQLNGVVCDSIANILSYENTKANVYNVVGKLNKWKDTATDGGSYGNFYLQDLEDPSKEILVYGATATASALTYVDGAYKFTNPKDWLTNSWTSAVKVGDIVALKAFRCDYKGTVEINGLYLGSGE